ncbi:hypothetical protein L0128_00945 [candidate division KSB1 bacterium]|nr:hypothetical protein [candidate division KSB1 bacterium]
MKTKSFLILWVLLGIQATAGNSGFFNHIRQQELLGARPLAMGEAFLAVANDLNAIAWNPAGLPDLNHLGFHTMHTNLFQSDIKCNYLALSIPGPKRMSFGVDWVNLGASDTELEFSKNKVNFSTGLKINDRLALGLNLKYLEMRAALDDISQGAFHGWGWDFGLLYAPLPRLNLGLVLLDASNTYLQGIDGPVYRSNLRIGAAYQVFPNLLLAMDLDDRLHLGTEWWPFQQKLALRAGLQRDFYSNEPLTFACGAGLDFPIWGQRLRFDYAFTDTPTLLNTNRFSLSFLIDLFPRLVKIKELEIKPIYASLYKFYAKNPIGKALVEYRGNKDLDCTVQVRVSKYGEQFSKNIILPASNSATPITTIDIKAIFNDSILTEPDNVPLRADVQLTYSSGQRPKIEKESQEFSLFARNAINWELGVEQAVAFITPDDPVVKNFCQWALEINPSTSLFGMNSLAIARALVLFDALRAFGMRYESDSYTPYSKTYQGFDTIYYPAQSLQGRRGDCDDLTVLMAALLESRNIPTLLVSVPGHIFLMFNSGVHTRRTFQLCCSEKDYYIKNNEIWIPLETTWLKHSFCEAWEKGAEELQQYADDVLQLIDVRASWVEYESIAYTGKIVKPDGRFLQTDLAQGRKDLEDKSKAYLAECEQKVAQFPDSLSLRNRLAVTYAFQNQFDTAEKHWRWLLARDSLNSVVLNNLGNLSFFRGDLDLAYAFYQKALLSAQNDARDGVLLNLGLTYAAVDSEHLAVELFAEVLGDSANYQKIENLLGISLESDVLKQEEKTKSKKKINSGKVRDLTRKAESQRKKGAGRRSEKLGQTGTKNHLPPDEVENVLYWAY